MDFTSDEGNLKENYIGLHRSSGEAFESISARIAATGDTVLAAKIAALHPQFTVVRDVDAESSSTAAKRRGRTKKDAAPSLSDPSADTDPSGDQRDA